MRTAERFLAILATTALILSTACSGSDANSPGPDVLADADAPDATPLGDLPGDTSTDTPPTPVPVAPALAAALQTVLDEYVRFSGDPGIAFAIHDGDKRTWSGVAGLADKVANSPVTALSQFRVGSNTKPITATWILQLVEEGKVELDAPLTDYLPEYTQWSTITVRHLLGMQSGIPEYIVDSYVLLQILSQPEHVYTPAEVLSFVADKPLAYPPGTAGSYSNSNWILLGMIGEKVTGLKAVDEMRTRFFEPLGLKNTYLEKAGDPAERLVHGYMDMSVLVPLMGLPSAMFAVIPEELYLAGTQTIDATSLLHPSLTWTAGAIVSNPDDLATFQRALQQGRLLGPEMMNQMHDWHRITLLGGDSDYGLGLMRQQTTFGYIYGHGGLNFGFHVETYYSPDLDMAFCHMHNFLPAQTVAVTSEALAVFLTDARDAPEECTIPAEFLGDPPVDQPVVKLVFKGVIGDKDKPAEAMPGMSSVWATLGTSWVRLFGFDRVGIFSAAVISTGDLGTFLTVNSWGKGDGGDNYLRELLLTMTPDMLEGMAADGVRTLTEADTYSAGLVLVDIELDASLKPKKSCVIATPDFTRTSRLFACDGPATVVAVGSTLRFSALLAMTTDIARIDSFMTILGGDRCACYDADGATTPCPVQ